ncbi:histidine triad (HIT) family protein [Allopseudospirillum japonicum]|uniref:Histidine triad (HIT) family protein n=1 Tax=Allopseudospirillum japonicum TaxID=64971 RepID=A0A1H6QF96_9GAMM|nr:histidine triad nucleotide-binding protein [Allopseudospirillum japonicum]SEI40556.1 histidine triad (HIT) family protein [Allopseudospirillum japonicum]
MDCIFCKLVKGELPADILYQDDEVMAFRDIDPKAPHHFLVIPKRHIATLNDLTPEDAALVGRLQVTAAQLAKEYGFDESGYRVVMNCNQDGGQTVWHIHMHVLAGRTLSWPPG